MFYHLNFSTLNKRYDDVIFEVEMQYLRAKNYLFKSSFSKV
jgi:hypothetical protein